MGELLTASRLRAYRKCPRYERLTYRDGWRTVETPDALAFGTLWHLGLEAWWTHGTLDAALAAVEGRGADPYTQAKCDEMLRGYHARWDHVELTVVGVEDEFRAPLLHPVTFEPHPYWSIGGKIDARAEMPDGRKLIVEHKTTSNDIGPTADYWTQLALDHQGSIYVIGAEAQFGWSATGILWDAARKPALRPLQANGKRAVAESPNEYAARLREAIAEAPEAYFQRREIARTESQLADFLEDAWKQANAMRDADDYRNPEACFQFGRCAFWDTCSAGLNPADYPTRFRQLTHAHPELTPDAMTTEV